MSRIRNVHERTVEAGAADVGALFDRLSADDDPVWPTPAWPPLIFDRPLSVGAAGGHGPIRYSVTEYEPGRRIAFAFTPPDTGFHELTVEPLTDDRCRIRHVLESSAPGLERISWASAVRWLHDAFVEDLFDNVERAVGSAVDRPAHWSPWVRFVQRVIWPRPGAEDPAAAGPLAVAAFPDTDFADAWTLDLRPGMPTDPDLWIDAILRPPAWVRALLGLRQALVGFVGIRRERLGMDGAFATVARDGDETLLGTDAGHLDFRLSVRVTPKAVAATTTVRLHNRRGRAYFAVVRLVHPPVVRAMLRRAHREITLTSPGRRLVG